MSSTHADSATLELSSNEMQHVGSEMAAFRVGAILSDAASAASPLSSSPSLSSAAIATTVLLVDVVGMAESFSVALASAAVGFTSMDTSAFRALAP